MDNQQLEKIGLSFERCHAIQVASHGLSDTDKLTFEQGLKKLYDKLCAGLPNGCLESMGFSEHCFSIRKRPSSPDSCSELWSMLARASPATLTKKSARKLWSALTSLVANF